jgi:hypothetical protein
MGGAAIEVGDILGKVNVLVNNLAAAGRIELMAVNFGLTPEQVKELTEAAARGATGSLTGRDHRPEQAARHHRGRGQDASAHRGW